MKKSQISVAYCTRKQVPIAIKKALIRKLQAGRPQKGKALTEVVEGACRGGLFKGTVGMD